MPKMKSRGAAKKRFRVTKNGKVKSSKTQRGHMHATKSAAAKRRKREAIVLTGTWATLMRRMMGG